MIGAQFSTPYILAVAALGVKPGSKWFIQKTLRKPSIFKLAKKVKLIGDPPLMNNFQRK